MASKQCGYCVYMDTMKEKEGRFLCEKTGCYNFADSDEAENCRRYCERFRRDMYLGDNAIAKSKAYKESHSTNFKPTGLCYITTIVVHILGLGDKCEELMALRNLRDNFMQIHPAYKGMLLKYDVLGPLIARSIINDSDPTQIASILYNNFIKECTAKINKGDFEGAICFYNEMTELLIKKYVSNYMIPEKVYDMYDQSCGGHGALVLKGRK